MLSFNLYVAIIAAFTLLRVAKSCPHMCRCDKRNTVYCNERQMDLIPYGIPEDTQTLHLQINNITNGVNVDDVLSRLSHLTKLDLHQNKLTSVPKNLPATLRYADFRNNDIRYVGKNSLAGLTSLTELHLDGNSIENQGLSHLAFDSTIKLEVLVLSGNKLKQFPEYLPASLLVLRLENNAIDVISKTATQRLSNVINLDLSQNALVQTRIFPDALRALTSLVTLDMSRNQLTEIPVNLPETVEELMLSENKIKFIYSDDGPTHGSLKALRKLQRVDLSSNLLKSVEYSSFSFLSLRSIELQENPWQCDCYLRYLKRWLSSDSSTLSSESNIRCHSPSAFSRVTLNSIDEEALTCDSRSNIRQMTTVYNVSSTGFNLLIKGFREMPDPPFIKRSLLYGPLKCGNCSVASLSGEAVTHLKKYSTQDLSTAIMLNPVNISAKVDRLFPDTNYGVCMFDSEQSDDFDVSQCLDVWTKPEKSSNSPSKTPQDSFLIWGIVIGGVVTLILCSVIVGVVIWKKTKSLKTKTPRLYPPTTTTEHYLVPERYIQGFSERVAYRSSLAPGYETSRSDRTYAECGPGSTAPKTLRDSAVDASMEFEVLMKTDETAANRRNHTPMSSLCRWVHVHV